MANLKRISRLNDGETIFKKSTWYKLFHTKRYPELFVKVSNGLFLDLDRYAQFIEKQRLVG